MSNYNGEIGKGFILGDVEYRKCKLCEGTGFQNWDESGNDIKSGPGDSEGANRITGKCAVCHGLGRILYCANKMLNIRRATHEQTPNA